MAYQLFKEQENLAAELFLWEIFGSQFEYIFTVSPEKLSPGSKTKGGGAGDCILVMGTKVSPKDVRHALSS